ncbi:hypothetical protein KCP74_01515 [Salmonella enterica subsp. enterica]|nr:hypothetical protein KCP74_01515 [Salmonella enterica subsp. enterica]
MRNTGTLRKRVEEAYIAGMAVNAISGLQARWICRPDKRSAIRLIET